MEHMLELYFHRGHLVASHCRRKSLKKEDLALGELLSSEEQVMLSLSQYQEKMLSEAAGVEKTARQQKKRQIQEVRSKHLAQSVQGVQWSEDTSRKDLLGFQSTIDGFNGGKAEVNLTTRFLSEKGFRQPPDYGMGGLSKF